MSFERFISQINFGNSNIIYKMDVGYVEWEFVKVRFEEFGEFTKKQSGDDGAKSGSGSWDDWDNHAALFKDRAWRICAELADVL